MTRVQSIYPANSSLFSYQVLGYAYGLGGAEFHGYRLMKEYSAENETVLDAYAFYKKLGSLTKLGYLYRNERKESSERGPDIRNYRITTAGQKVLFVAASVMEEIADAFDVAQYEIRIDHPIKELTSPPSARLKTLLIIHGACDPEGVHAYDLTSQYSSRFGLEFAGRFHEKSLKPLVRQGILSASKMPSPEGPDRWMYFTQPLGKFVLAQTMPLMRSIISGVEEAST